MARGVMSEKFYLGTMGFSYKDWEGPFYPVGMATQDYLTFYSRAFNGVEIDSTFYGTPRVETVQRWATLTPNEFRFCAKTPRMITHDLSLEGTRGLMDEFVNVIRALDQKLGVILLQFPPSFGIDRFSQLESFLDDLPPGARYAIEVRDRSWHAEAGRMADLLQAHGVSWAATEYPNLPARIYRTADFLYIRWIGQHGTYKHHSRERIDRTPEMRRWWEGIEAVLAEVEAVYGFFNNDYAGFAAGTARRFKAVAGLPVEEAPVPKQPRLF